MLILGDWRYDKNKLKSVARNVLVDYTCNMRNVIINSYYCILLFGQISPTSLQI